MLVRASSVARGSTRHPAPGRGRHETGNPGSARPRQPRQGVWGGAGRGPGAPQPRVGGVVGRPQRARTHNSFRAKGAVSSFRSRPLLLPPPSESSSCCPVPASRPYAHGRSCWSYWGSNERAVEGRVWAWCMAAKVGSGRREVRLSSSPASFRRALHAPFCRRRTQAKLGQGAHRAHPAAKGVLR